MTTTPSEPEIVVGEVAEEVVTNLPAVRAAEAVITMGEITVDQVVAQKDKIRQVMERVMTRDVHYGVIPGTTKPTLYKPGAEAINVALRLAPHYESEKIIDGAHLTVFVRCSLQHIPTGLVIATGEGMCSTKESKYATRKAKRVCPACGAPAIIKGKAEYGGGWVCWKKADTPGCGVAYADDDVAITDQAEGTIENPDLPDQWNTVLKMADKRALIAAVLNGTAASDVFTQDVEDASTQPEPQDVPASTQPQPQRQEGRTPYPIPKSWPKIEQAIKQADNPDEAWSLFEAFIRACSYHLFGVPDSGDLSREQKTTVAQKAAGAAVWLHENVEHDGPFFYFDRDSTRLAWAAMLDGAMLEIPDYREPEPPITEAEQEEIERIAAEVFENETEAEAAEAAGAPRVPKD